MWRWSRRRICAKDACWMELVFHDIRPCRRLWERPKMAPGSVTGSTPRRVWCRCLAVEIACTDGDANAAVVAAVVVEPDQSGDLPLRGTRGKHNSAGGGNRGVGLAPRRCLGTMRLLLLCMPGYSVVCGSEQFFSLLPTASIYGDGRTGLCWIQLDPRDPPPLPRSTFSSQPRGRIPGVKRLEIERSEPFHFRRSAAGFGVLWSS